MTIALPRSACAFVLTGMLAACGNGGGTASGAAADWAVDACKTLPASAAGKIAGVAVAKAELAGQTSTDQTILSHCSYATADGKTNFGVMLRQDRTGQTTVAEQIERAEVSARHDRADRRCGRARRQGGLDAQAPHAVYVPDDARMVVVTPPGAVVIGGQRDPDDVLKQKALAMAQAAAR